MATATKDERLNLRIDGAVKEEIATAARLRGVSTSEFITQAAAEAANRVISEHHLRRLTEPEFERFLTALEEDVEPNAAALAAARRFNETTRIVDGTRCSVDTP